MLAAATLPANTPSSLAAPPRPTSAATAHAIPWRDWEAAAFAEAKRTGRLVLLHIAASWAHGSILMDRETWPDTGLVRVVTQGYVPIRVDADRRPDIADRYLAGAWPTTAVLTSDGQLVHAQIVIAPDPLKHSLEDLRAHYLRGKSEVERRAAESKRRVARTWASGPLVPSEMPLEEWLDRNVSALVDAEDKERGGIAGKPKTPQFPAVEFLLDASAARSQPLLRSLALRVLDAALALEDSVWGGFYRLARDEDWKRPATEKILGVNARAILALARAVEADGGARYREAARRTEAYATAWLWDSRHRAWRGSQAADRIGADGRLTPGEIYYGLSDAARRRLGAPAIDSAFYADQNARMASAIFRGAAAGIWKGGPVARAEQALDRLWAKQRARDGSLYHVWDRGTNALPGLLADQAAAGIAYLDAYAVTKERRHLERAEALARWIGRHLEDRVGGGFRYGPRDSTAIGRLAAGDKPEAGNLDAAWFFLRLYETTRRPEDFRIAERTFEYLRAGETVPLDPARAALGLRLRRVKG